MTLATLEDTRERAALAPYAEAAHDAIGASMAPNTRRAYRTQWAAFTMWADGRGVQSLPAAPETLAAYLAARAEADGLKLATLKGMAATVRRGQPRRDPARRGRLIQSARPQGRPFYEIRAVLPRRYPFRRPFPALHRFELDSPRPRHVCYALTQPTAMFAVGAFGGGCPAGGKVGQFSGG